jgi:serine/threonine protein kinase
MTYLDFSNYGYEIIRELGHNRAGGRITYLAKEINTQEQVVVKQFQFARPGASWREYDSYEKEITILKRINHPQIPRYRDAFATPTGFCMIQEYKNAYSLADVSDYQPEEVKQIALGILDILCFLQNQIPPIIHRDLKPENILIDESLQVSLVDFGFARLGSAELAVSSVVKGTLGFMPPEQIFNRQLSPASDLYSLGMTLIALLTKTHSTEISKLIDNEGKVKFKDQVTHLHPDFIYWLEKMVEPQSKNRFPNAQVALNSLISLTVLAPAPSFLSSFSLRRKYIFVVFLASSLLGTAAYLGRINLLKNSKLINLSTANQSAVKKVKLSDKSIKFTLEIPSSKFRESTTEVSCQLYDSFQRLAALGNRKLAVKGQNLTTDCDYRFLDNDPRGNWRIKFFVDNQLLAEKIL